MLQNSKNILNKCFLKALMSQLYRVVTDGILLYGRNVVNFPQIEHKTKRFVTHNLYDKNIVIPQRQVFDFLEMLNLKKIRILEN